MGDHRSPDQRGPQYIQVDRVLLHVSGCLVQRSRVVEEEPGVIPCLLDLTRRIREQDLILLSKHSNEH